MEVIGAIDQGTQSTRFYLFDSAAKPIAFHQADLPQIYPHAGWCEHDAKRIWETVEECIKGALQAAEAKVGPVKVVALGITNQRETTVVWDRRTGEPIHNAVVWLDNRTWEICHEVEKQVGSKAHFQPITGLPISTYFSAYKYLWLHKHVAKVREAMEQGHCMFGTIDSWLIYNLTGGVHGGIHVTDVSNASRTNLMDLNTCTWHPQTLELFNIRPEALPRIVSNAEVYGTVSASVADGLLTGTPIAGCLGDQQAAMLGQRCVVGEAKNTYGTGCFMLLNTGTELTVSSHGLLSTVAFKLGPEHPTQYALEGSIGVAGMGVSWLKDNLGLIASPAESESLASTVPDTAGVYFVPAFGGLLAPHWRDDARGVILGLTGFTRAAHVVRALLESICFQTREVLDAMRQDAVMDIKVLRVDGGATKNNLLMQLQSDLLQLPVARPEFQETTSLGAALAAGLAVGFWKEEEVFTHDDVGITEFTPSITPDATEKRYTRWKKAVQRSLDLADLADEEPY